MRRFRKLLKRAALAAAAIVGLILIVTAVRSVWASARLERAIAALRAAGDPVSLADLAREPVPPENNAATYLRRAKSDVEAIPQEVHAVYQIASEAEREAFDAGNPPAAMLSTIRAALTAYPNVFALLEQAANCADYDPQLNVNTDTQSFQADLLPHLEYTRAVFRVLNYRALVQLADGHAEDALRTCLVMFQLARHFDRDPTIISQMVAIAIRGVAVRTANRALRASPLGDSAYAALEAELARHDMTEQYRHALRTERAYGLQGYREMSSQIGATSILPWFKNDQCDYLDLLEKSIQAAARPYSDWNAFYLQRLGPITRLMPPAIQAVRDAVARVQAELRTLRVLNAILRYERAGNTDEPKLSDLGLPADAMTDPFNGEPLHLKKLPEGWLVYAVGNDLKDGGGAHLLPSPELEQDVGLGPIEAPEAAAAGNQPAE